MKILILVLCLASLTTACGPKNVVLSPAGQKAYTADEAIKGLASFAATARNLNKSTGATHLSDKDTEIVRLSTVAIGNALADWQSGKGPYTTVMNLYHAMVAQLTPVVQINDKLRYALGVVDAILANVKIDPSK